MKDGLYKVAFQTPVGSGAGVVVLEGGKIRGGDTAMYYVGTYTEQGGQFTAEVASARHTPGLPSVFGHDSVNISLKGTATETSATMTGTAKQVPGVTFQATLSRLGD